MEHPYYYKIAKYSFWILLFFTLWGTEIPSFKSTVEKETSTNIVNQLLYSILFLTSLFCLILKKKEFFRLVRDEKFLTLFILLSLTSILWSQYPFLTFKRLFQIIAIFLTSATFLIYVNESNEIIKPFKYILYPYLILTLLVIIALPAARSESNMWRGFTTNKNTLGQISVMSAILCYIIYKYEALFYKKMVALGMIFLSALFTFGSRSSTSLLAILFLISLGTILLVDLIFKPVNIGRTVSFIIISSFTILVAGILAVFPQISAVLPELFGKDSSFSGRSELWNYLLTTGRININPFIGTGFGAFWVPESNRIIGVYNVFIWIPLQAHNGYIDIFLASGYIGCLIVLSLIVFYFINYYRIQKPHPWVLFIVVILLFNFQESSIFRTGAALNFIFMFSYLLLFVNKSKNLYWAPGGDER